MKKSILILGFLLAVVLSINFVSAGLCRGYDGYYHDCDDSKYFDNRNYDDEYYYHGKYYPTRDYYYRDYYKPRYKTRKYDTEIEYRDVEEYKRTIEYNYEDRYRAEKIKYTINEKTEIELDYDYPYYYNYKPLRYDYKNENKQDDEPIIKPIPYHYSQYKTYY